MKINKHFKICKMANIDSKLDGVLLLVLILMNSICFSQSSKKEFVSLKYGYTFQYSEDWEKFSEQERSIREKELEELAMKDVNIEVAFKN